MIFKPSVEKILNHPYFILSGDVRSAHLMSECIKPNESTSACDFFMCPQWIVFRLYCGQMTNNNMGKINTYTLNRVHLFKGTGRAALMWRMGKNGQPGLQMCTSNCSVYFAFIRAHFERRGNFTESTPPLCIGVSDQLLYQFIFRHRSHTNWITGKSNILKITTSHDDINFTTVGNGINVLYLFRGSSACGCINNTTKPIESTFTQFFHRQVYFSTTHVFMKKCRSVG